MKKIKNDDLTNQRGSTYLIQAVAVLSLGMAILLGVNGFLVGSNGRSGVAAILASRDACLSGAGQGSYASVDLSNPNLMAKGDPCGSGSKYTGPELGDDN